ncbi:hypothetical protein [Streptomyces sp. NPDC093261]|uniref:hypothetical protein n=1 Tax=Streptomyces sp. NPDC093261 TaxID=3366037 RepID=UPI00382958A3
MVRTSTAVTPIPAAPARDLAPAAASTLSYARSSCSTRRPGRGDLFGLDSSTMS